MESKDPTVFTKTYEEGVERVLKVIFGNRYIMGTDILEKDYIMGQVYLEMDVSWDRYLGTDISWGKIYGSMSIFLLCTYPNRCRYNSWSCNRDSVLYHYD